MEVNSYYSNTRSSLPLLRSLLVPTASWFLRVDRGVERVRKGSTRLGTEFGKFGKERGSREVRLGRKGWIEEVLRDEKKILEEMP